MDLQLLETFLVVCEERNLSRAAVRLFRTQPAITRQVQALEARVGATLLERSPRGVRLTPAGEELRARGARILAELKSLKELGVEDGKGPSGELHIACSDNVASHFLAPLLGRFAKACPRVRIRLVNGVTPSIANLVEREVCELGFVLLPLRNPRLELKPVLRYRNIAVFPPRLVPRGVTQISVRELCGHPLVLLTRDTATRRSFDAMVRSQRLEPRHVLEVGSIAVQKAMVKAGLGVGILPEYTLRRGEGLSSLPIRGAEHLTLALCHLKAKVLGLPARNLVAMMAPLDGPS